MNNDARKEFDNSIRDSYFNLHPLCEYCGSKGEHIHHITPISRGGDNRESNLITLCLNCHSKIHNRNFTEDWKQLQREGIEIAKKMQNRNMQPEEISQITGLSLEQLRQI